VKRSDLIKAAPLGLLAACGGGASSLLTAQESARFPSPRHRHGLDCNKPLWDFDWSFEGKSDQRGFATALRKLEPSCGFQNVGNIEEEIRLGKYGNLLSATMILTILSDGKTYTKTIDMLGSEFSRKSIVHMFKNWYFKVDSDALGGTLYDQSTGATLVTTRTDYYLTKSTMTVYSGSNKSPGVISFDWDGCWGGSGGALKPAVSEECVLNFISELLGCAATVITAMLLLYPPATLADWAAFLGAAGFTTQAAAATLNSCNR